MAGGESWSWTYGRLRTYEREHETRIEMKEEDPTTRHPKVKRRERAIEMYQRFRNTKRKVETDTKRVESHMCEQERL